MLTYVNCQVYVRSSTFILNSDSIGNNMNFSLYIHISQQGNFYLFQERAKIASGQLWQQSSSQLFKCFDRDSLMISRNTKSCVKRLPSFAKRERDREMVTLRLEL